ncbi:carbamoyltransferase HypF [Streptomyces sp. NPDC004111]|uniref:carbamoyltransferase HypF n=1 Tax=Streptomyces sp. NPDC004111 TaxID=3364690 RepID=UPI00369657BE
MTGALPTVVRFEVFGTVQGVGYRPFVHRLATGLGLDGWAANTGGHVEGVVAGDTSAVEDFLVSLRTDAPALARVRRVRRTAAETVERGQLARPGTGFTVRGSSVGHPGSAGPREIPPDVATCEACLRELLDPRDRRHRYPFISCTDCGPRATVVEDMPYDRVRTTMRRFPLCPRCAAEYADPADRRFHAESLACPDCGPQLAWHAPHPQRALGPDRGTYPERDPEPLRDVRSERGILAEGDLLSSRDASTGHAPGPGCVPVPERAADPGRAAGQGHVPGPERAAVPEHAPSPGLAPTPKHVPSPDPERATGPAHPPGPERTPRPAHLSSGPRDAQRLSSRTVLRGESALRAAVEAVRGGGIVAVKGLGGYQLVCDATDAVAVAALRERKQRPVKPFAVMVADIAAARELARVPATGRAALESPVRPVVLLPARRTAVAAGVHPGTRRIGLFLPTTGLHHLLLRALAGPLVVTSGNLAGGPIVVDDEEARRVLGSVADGFLVHDRPIRARYDDSVVQLSGRRPSTLRRARGLAPVAVPLPVAARTAVVAAGAQLKHTFALATGNCAQLSPQGGDLADAATLDAFARSYAHLSRLTGFVPAAVAHDLHPGYLSTQWAHAQRLPRVPVQHHHAHLAACAAEHGLRGPFTGVAYDGLGLGDDGTLWGGEILVGDLTGCRRAGRFATAPLPGGEAAVRHPWRMALGYLFAPEVLGAPRPYSWLVRSFTARFDPREVAVVRTLAERGLNSPRASSAGRLFDAVASLLGLADTVGYEGEAAAALENASDGARAEPLAHRLVRERGLWVYDPAPTLTDLLERQHAGEAVPRLAAAFHLAVAGATADMVARVVAAGAPRTVCLAGGCFANRRLLAETRRLLRAQGLRVLVARSVPVGDGGISYGQAAVAAARLAKE